MDNKKPPIDRDPTGPSGPPPKSRHPRPLDAYLPPTARSALSGVQPKLSLLMTEDGRYVPAALDPQDDPAYRKARIEAFVQKNVNKAFRDYRQRMETFLSELPRLLAAYWEFSDAENDYIAAEIERRARQALAEPQTAKERP